MKKSWQNRRSLPSGTRYFLTKRLLTLGLTVAALALSFPAFAQQTIPSLSGPITDLTGTLSASQRMQLRNVVDATEQQKGSQIAVLIVPTTQPEEIEQYAIRVAEQWKLGRKGIDDGVILVIAKNDRKVRIEAGYGLEGAIPDVVAKRIIEELIVPKFRDGDFFGGVISGVQALARVISGEPLPEPKQSPWGKGSFGGDGLQFLFFVGLFASQAGTAMLTPMMGRGFSASLIGVIFGLVALMFLPPMFAFLIGCVVAIFGLMPAASVGSGRSGRYGRTGGWSSSRSSGGSSYRGGGGSFGGGGASGSW